MSEHDEQVALFEWAKLTEALYPDIEWMFAIPNGGHRHIAVATKMKREGVKAGVLDIWLPAPKGKYPGMYIEMKFGRNKPSDAQKRWIEAFRGYGYRVRVCYSFEEAQAAIIEYLELSK